LSSDPNAPTSSTTPPLISPGGLPDGPPTFVSPSYEPSPYAPPPYPAERSSAPANGYGPSTAAPQLPTEPPYFDPMSYARQSAQQTAQLNAQLNAQQASPYGASHVPSGSIPTPGSAVAMPQGPPSGHPSGGYSGFSVPTFGQPPAPPTGPLRSGRGSESGPDRPRPWLGVAVIGAVIGALVASLVGGGIYAASTGDDGDPVSVVTGSPSRAPVTISGTELDIRALLDKARPSVVSIDINSSEGEAAGSGIVIDDRGTVLTNAHVIGGAAGMSNAINIAFSDGDIQPAQLVGSFPDQDVALIRITGSKVTTPAELGISDDLQVGDDVVAIGNALNLGADPSVTKGIVSALNRELAAEGEQLDHLIQTDAAINPGNSGGPLVNAFGQVVGVNTAIIQNSQSVGFALAIDSIKPLIEDIENGKGAIDGDSPFLGVVTTNVDDQPADIISRFDISVDAGAFVADVQPDSAADKAGLKAGDVVTAIDGVDISSNMDVGNVIRDKKPGDTITIEYQRQGDAASGQAQLGRRGG